jgi:transposase
MPAQRLTMRRVRELLRLHYGMGASARAIARELGVSRSTVKEYLARATAAGLTWPLADDLTDGVLEEGLFAASGPKPGARRRAEPDWAALVREMKRPGVNLTVLWEEYGEAHPGGYSYSRFCELYRDFERRLSPTMRQHHVAGDKVFVDYSGKTVPIVDRETGEVRPAQLFVAVLGASNYTYAEVSWTQALPDWIGAHVHMFAFFQGCPRLVVPDNLKSGIHKPSFYDPEINRSYARMAAHYRVGILPARPYKPRDKAKVEAGVRFAQSYILGRLRHLTFFSLAECQTAVCEALRRMNERPMRRLGISRQALFEASERPALQTLPSTEYVYAEWRLARVGPDYHVEIHSFFYSVPHSLIREQVEVCITARTIEIFHRGKRVAAHLRRYGGRLHGTDPEHMPSAHRRYAEWTPERFQRWGRSIGPNTEGLIIAILAHRPHPEQGFRTCLGVMRLLRGVEPARAERVAARAVEIGALNYKSIASILANNLDRRLSTPSAGETVIVHANIRGPRYFH